MCCELVDLLAGRRVIVWKSRLILRIVASPKATLMRNPQHTDISKSVVTQPLFGRISDAFTYEERRGRESNPRIAVLQTATLPLGYPADVRERTISL